MNSIVTLTLSRLKRIFCQASKSEYLAVSVINCTFSMSTFVNTASVSTVVVKVDDISLLPSSREVESRERVK